MMVTDVELMSRSELEAEVEALRYKLSEMTTHEIDWVIHLGIPPQRRRMLTYMLANQGRMIARVALHESMYDWEPPTEPKIVDVLICHLRKTLADKAPHVEIRRHWGDGYSIHVHTPTKEPLK